VKKMISSASFDLNLSLPGLVWAPVAEQMLQLIIWESKISCGDGHVNATHFITQVSAEIQDHVVLLSRWQHGDALYKRSSISLLVKVTVQIKGQIFLPTMETPPSLPRSSSQMCNDHMQQTKLEMAIRTVEMTRLHTTL
jgi:hypothetical protein